MSIGSQGHATESPLPNLTSIIKGKLHTTGELRISSMVKSSIAKYQKELTTTHLVEEVAALVGAIDVEDNDICLRLNGPGAVLLCGILVRSPSCLAQQRGICLLAASIHGIESDTDVASSYKAKKKKSLALSVRELVRIFVGNAPLDMRKWIGVLALELVTGCKSNADRLCEDANESLFDLGDIATTNDCHVLRHVAVSIISQLVSYGTSLSVFFTGAQREQLQELFPDGTHHDAQWAISFEEYLENLADDNDLSTLEQSFFASAVGFSKKEYHADKKAAILISFGADMNIVIPSSTESSAIYIDVPFNNVASIYTENFMSQVSQEASFGLRIDFTSSKKETFFFNAKGSTEPSLALGFSTDSARSNVKKRFDAFLDVPEMLLPSKVQTTKPIDISKHAVEESFGYVEETDTGFDSIEHDLASQARSGSLSQVNLDKDRTVSWRYSLPPSVSEAVLGRLKKPTKPATNDEMNSIQVPDQSVNGKNGIQPPQVTTPSSIRVQGQVSSHGDATPLHVTKNPEARGIRSHRGSLPDSQISYSGLSGSARAGLSITALLEKLPAKIKPDASKSRPVTPKASERIPSFTKGRNDRAELQQSGEAARTPQAHPGSSLNQAASRPELNAKNNDKASKLSRLGKPLFEKGIEDDNQDDQDELSQRNLKSQPDRILFNWENAGTKKPSAVNAAKESDGEITSPEPYRQRRKGAKHANGKSADQKGRIQRPRTNVQDLAISPVRRNHPAPPATNQKLSKIQHPKSLSKDKLSRSNERSTNNDDDMWDEGASCQPGGSQDHVKPQNKGNQGKKRSLRPAASGKSQINQPPTAKSKVTLMENGKKKPVNKGSKALTRPFKAVVSSIAPRSRTTRPAALKANQKIVDQISSEKSDEAEAQDVEPRKISPLIKEPRHTRTEFQIMTASKNAKKTMAQLTATTSNMQNPTPEPALINPPQVLSEETTLAQSAQRMAQIALSTAEDNWQDPAHEDGPEQAAVRKSDSLELIMPGDDVKPPEDEVDLVVGQISNAAPPVLNTDQSKESLCDAALKPGRTDIDDKRPSTTKRALFHKSMDPVAAKIQEMETQLRSEAGATGGARVTQEPRKRQKVTDALRQKDGTSRVPQPTARTSSHDNENEVAACAQLAHPPVKDVLNTLSEKRKAQQEDGVPSKRPKQLPSSRANLVVDLKYSSQPKTPISLLQRKSPLIGWSHSGPLNQGIFTTSGQHKRHPAVTLPSATSPARFGMKPEPIAQQIQDDASDGAGLGQNPTPNDTTNSKAPVCPSLKPANDQTGSQKHRHNSQVNVTESGSPIHSSQRRHPGTVRDKSVSDMGDVEMALEVAREDKEDDFLANHEELFPPSLPHGALSNPEIKRLAESPHKMQAPVHVNAQQEDIRLPTDAEQNLALAKIKEVLHEARSSSSADKTPVQGESALSASADEVKRSDRTRLIADNNQNFVASGRLNASFSTLPDLDGISNSVPAGRLQSPNRLEPELARVNKTVSAVEAQGYPDLAPEPPAFRHAPSALSQTTGRAADPLLQSIHRHAPTRNTQESLTEVHHTRNGNRVSDSGGLGHSVLCQIAESKNRVISRIDGVSRQNKQKPSGLRQSFIPSRKQTPSSPSAPSASEDREEHHLDMNGGLVNVRTLKPLIPLEPRNPFKDYVKIKNTSFLERLRNSSLCSTPDAEGEKIAGREQPKVRAKSQDLDENLVAPLEPVKSRKRKAEVIEVSSSKSSTDSSEDDSALHTQESDDEDTSRHVPNYEPHQRQMLLVLNGIMNRLVQHQVKREDALKGLIDEYLQNGKEAVRLFVQEYTEELANDGNGIGQIQNELSAMYEQMLQDMEELRKPLHKYKIKDVGIDQRSRHQRILDVAKAALDACEI